MVHVLGKPDCMVRQPAIKPPLHTHYLTQRRHDSGLIGLGLGFLYAASFVKFRDAMEKFVTGLGKITEVGSETIHYQVFNESALENANEAILFFHGQAGGSFQWEALDLQLPSNFAHMPVIAVNRAGYLKSSIAKDTAGLKDHAHSAKRLLDQLPLQTNFKLHLMGLDVGCAYALSFAQQYSELVKSSIHLAPIYYRYV